MDKLTIVSFKQLLNDMSFDDKQDVLKENVKEVINNHNLFVYNNVFKLKYFIYAKNKNEAVEKYIRYVNNYELHEYIYSHIDMSTYKCEICTEEVRYDHYLLSEHADSHSKEELIEHIREDVSGDIKLYSLIL